MVDMLLLLLLLLLLSIDRYCMDRSDPSQEKPCFDYAGGCVNLDVGKGVLVVSRWKESKARFTAGGVEGQLALH